MIGWTCPKCSRVWSPATAACSPCNSGVGANPYVGLPTWPPLSPMRPPNWSGMSGSAPQPNAVAAKFESLHGSNTV